MIQLYPLACSCGIVNYPVQKEHMNLCAASTV